MTEVAYRRMPANGIEIFYREAGRPDAPTHPAAARLSDRQPHVPRSLSAAGRSLSTGRPRSSGLWPIGDADRWPVDYTFENLAWTMGVLY